MHSPISGRRCHCQQATIGSNINGEQLRAITLNGGGLFITYQAGIANDLTFGGNNSGNTLVTGAITFAGPGMILNNRSGGAGTTTVSGITTAGYTTITNNAATTLTIAGPALLTNGNFLTVNGAGNTTITAVISGGNALSVLNMVGQERQNAGDAQTLLLRRRKHAT